MARQKACEYKEYPKTVTNEDGDSKIVNSAEAEAEYTGKPLDDVLEQNAANAMTPVEKLKKADEILAEAKRIREEAEAHAAAGKEPAKPEEAGPETTAASTQEEKPSDTTETQIECADDVPEGDKNALEAYAKGRFGIDIDKRKGFETLLEQVKQEEAKAA